MTGVAALNIIYCKRVSAQLWGFSLGVFSRVTSLLKANINDVLARSERPEQELQSWMADLRAERRRAHLQVLRCITDEKRLEIQIREREELVGQWQQRAQMAVDRDQDDLAREALQARQTSAVVLQALQRQYESQRDLVAQLEDAIRQLDYRYQEAEIRKQQILDEYRIARAQRSAMEALGKANGLTRSDELTRVEEHLQTERGLAAAETEFASDSMEDQFRKLEMEGSIEEELVRLKLASGKGAPEVSAPPRAPAALPD